MISFLRRHVYGTATVALVVVFMIAFVVVEQLQLPVLTDPHPGATGQGWAPGIIGVTLLITDVILPVPSSGVMIVQGAVYGIGVGAVLSVIGATGATVVGFLLGRRGQPVLERWAGAEQQARAVALLDRYGVWAIIATRPVPLLAESVSIMAGTGHLRWWQVAWAGAVGNIVPAIGYAAVGAYAATFVNALTVFGVVIAVAGIVWLVQYRVGIRTRSQRVEASDRG
ncbi:MAG TPA: VTT domain-containing protein [Microlunatus sp.]